MAVMTILSLDTALPPSWITAFAAGGLALISSVCLLSRLRSIAGTTLLAPWIWSMLAIWAVAGVEIAVGLAYDDSVPSWSVAARFAAAVVVFCPTVAILGAKRPQNRPWQFLVVSLWAVLSLPAWESLLLRPGQPLAMQDARWWCFPVLIIVGTANFLPTRNWAAAVAVGTAQALLVAGYVPWLATTQADTRLVLSALLLAAIGALLAMLTTARRRASDSAPDRLWLDFRDAYGALWALRIAQRLNATAAEMSWKTRLQWQGFRPAETAAEDESAAQSQSAAARNFESLLRRFVSRRWIARRRAA